MASRSGWVNVRRSAFLNRLTQKPVGVFVGSALPGMVRGAEVDRHRQRGGDAFMLGHFPPTVPCQRPSQVRWQLLEVGDQRVCDGIGPVPVG